MFSDGHHAIGKYALIPDVHWRMDLTQWPRVTNHHLNGTL